MTLPQHGSFLGFRHLGSHFVVESHESQQQNTDEQTLIKQLITYYNTH